MRDPGVLGVAGVLGPTFLLWSLKSYLNEVIFRLYLDFREFITSLSLTSRGTPDEKLCWAFNMYDINGDGRISINEVINIVKSVQELLTLDSMNRLKKLFGLVIKTKMVD